ncbi:MAG: hypothetical protein ACJAYB_000087 [Psychromonas sp.]|jgi:hypothetical protein
MNKLQKETAIELMKGHQVADLIQQGDWFNPISGVGCCYGCMMQTDDNALEKAAVFMGVPLWFVYLSEAVFEGLPEEDSIFFPVQLLQLIPVDTDLTPVLHLTAIARLTPLAALTTGEVKSCINAVIDLHKDWENATIEMWRAAQKAAHKAWLECPVFTAAESAAKSAAYSAGLSAESVYSVCSGAWSALSALSARGSGGISPREQERDNLFAALRSIS